MNQATAFAPASVGNVGVGFDVLGLAIAGPGDRCTAVRAAGRGVRVTAIRGLPVALPLETGRNTAGTAAASLLEAVKPGFGVEIQLEKGIPLGSGMGGSAASAVAAVVAVNALLDEPLPLTALLSHALAGETLASGGVVHADNVAPALHGGLTIVLPGNEERDWYVASVPAPAELRCVLVHPHLRVETGAARAALEPSVPMSQVIEQIGAVAGFVSGCHDGDLELIRRSLRDPIVERQRAHFVPDFHAVQSSAMDEGALGCSLSGSGPSMFAWCREDRAGRVAAAMRSVFAARGVGTDFWISPLDAPGARLDA